MFVSTVNTYLYLPTCCVKIKKNVFEKTIYSCLHFVGCHCNWYSLIFFKNIIFLIIFRISTNFHQTPINPLVSFGLKKKRRFAIGNSFLDFPQDSDCQEGYFSSVITKQCISPSKEVTCLRDT